MRVVTHFFEIKSLESQLLTSTFFWKMKERIIRKKTQTAVINMAIKRMFENKVQSQQLALYTTFGSWERLILSL